MHARLGHIRLNALSDGGFSLQPNPNYPCIYPVLSIEVKLLPEPREEVLTSVDET